MRVQHMRIGLACQWNIGYRCLDCGNLHNGFARVNAKAAAINRPAFAYNNCCF